MTMPLYYTRHLSYETAPETPLQRVLRGSADHFTISPSTFPSTFGTTEIKGNLSYIANQVERAFVLTPREALPKVRSVEPGAFGRHFYFTDGRNSISASSSYTSERARKVATSYLAVAAYLEAEESAKEKADAAAAKVAEAAAKNARQSRLNDIADLYFGKDFDELGDNKASAVKEIYRLEEKLKQDDEGKDAA